MAAIGATRPLRRISGIVSFLNPPPALSTALHAPFPVIARPQPNWLGRVESFIRCTTIGWPG